MIAKGQRGAPRVSANLAAVRFTREGDAYVTSLNGRSHTRGGGIALHFDAANEAQALTQDIDGQKYFHAEIPLAGNGWPRPMPRTIGLLWDSSGSARNRDIDTELALLDRYFAAVGDGEVRLIRLRDVPERTETFRVRGGDWSALRSSLRETVYDGASALADWQPQPDVQEYLLVSDGLANYGTAKRMPELTGAQRLYALDSAGANADAGRLAVWADARGGRLVSWQGIAGVAEASARLLEDGPRLLSIEGLGADAIVAASPHPQSGYLRVAGRLNQAAATIVLRVLEAGRERRIQLPVASLAPDSSQVAALWAAYSIEQLSAEPDLHRAQIRRIGNQFGLVSAETSLIVLDDLADYARYEIAPPAEYRVEVARLAAASIQRRGQAQQGRLDALAARYGERIRWWEATWPKDRPGTPVSIAEEMDASDTANDRSAALAVASVAPVHPAMLQPGPQPPTPAPVSSGNTTLDRIQVTGSHMSAEDPAAAEQGAHGAAIGIAMQPWQPDSAFARRLRGATPATVYAIYLDERDDHLGSSAFYLDVADILFERGQRDLALRVLSNLAEMNLENRQLLRVLGYRLMQADVAELAIPVFQRVSRLIEEEPQSFRDLGLAYAAAGRTQDAVESLYRVVTGEWDARFPGVDLIALGELNAAIATARTPLDTGAIDARLLRNLPVDLRVVLSWDSDNSDMDLWVTDPNGEKTYYSNPRSYQGGWMSNDFTGGYGPEEFLLRDAKPGKYRVEANFYGDRQQVVTGATTLQLQLFTGYGSPRQKDQSVTLRLKGASETVLVGEFDVE